MWDTFKDMYAYLWDMIYAILEIFGYVYDEEAGKIVKVDAE